MRALIVFLLFFPTLVLSQGAATLVADDVIVTADNRLVATGNIEVFYNGTRMSAAQIIYAQNGDQLIITGPILIQGPDGTILTADRASLDPKLENGVLRGARLVLDQQLQLAANQIDRVDGRYSQLYKVAATSCRVCSTRAPLWEIRAKQVIHDQDEQQLYFNDAQFLIRGMPVFWLPRVRLPDPALERATGFLTPDLPTSDLLGTGLRVPYFIRIGDDLDLTLTPFVSSKTTTLEYIYRQAFMRGDITVEGAISQDTLVPDTTRAYIFVDGNFDLGGDHQLQFDVEATSDKGYLLDYGYSEKDRLDSNVTLLRVGETDLSQASLTVFQTLRDDESNATLPPIVGSTSYENRASFAAGGVLRYGVSADTVFRYGTPDGDAARDVSRVGATAGLSRDLISQSGLVMRATADVRADWYGVNDDARYGNGVRVAPTVGLKLSYPLATTTASGAQHLVTPTIALGWADQFGVTPPNEDSTRAEFDQANLFNLSQFPSDDAIATGTSAAVGVTWTRLGAEGAASTLTFGRVFLDTASANFSPSSGLDGLSSDWLLAGQYAAPSGWQADGRTLFDDDAHLTRAAARLGWQTQTLDLGAAYIWQAADPTESRPDAVSEWTVDTQVQLTPTWAMSFDARYDLAAQSPARAGLGIQYQNECVSVDFSVSRRHTSSATVEPSNSYGLQVSLNGFSTSGGQVPATSCR